MGSFDKFLGWVSLAYSIFLGFVVSFLLAYVGIESMIVFVSVMAVSAILVVTFLYVPYWTLLERESLGTSKWVILFVFSVLPVVIYRIAAQVPGIRTIFGS